MPNRPYGFSFVGEQGKRALVGMSVNQGFVTVSTRTLDHPAFIEENRREEDQVGAYPREAGTPEESFGFREERLLFECRNLQLMISSKSMMRFLRAKRMVSRALSFE